MHPEKIRKKNTSNGFNCGRRVRLKIRKRRNREKNKLCSFGSRSKYLKIPKITSVLVSMFDDVGLMYVDQFPKNQAGFCDDLLLRLNLPP